MGGVCPRWEGSRKGLPGRVRVLGFSLYYLLLPYTTGPSLTASSSGGADRRWGPASGVPGTTNDPYRATTAVSRTTAVVSDSMHAGRTRVCPDIRGSVHCASVLVAPAGAALSVCRNLAVPRPVTRSCVPTPSVPLRPRGR